MLTLQSREAEATTRVTAVLDCGYGFAGRSWSHRNRVIGVRAGSRPGLEAIARSLGLALSHR